MQGVPFRCLPVAGALVHAGFEVLFCDQGPDLDHDPDGARVLRSELETCRAVVFWNQDLDPSIQAPELLGLATHIRGWYPHLPIAAGGGFLAILPTAPALENSPIDHVLTDYGLASLPRLIAAIHGDLAFERVPGLIRKGNPPRVNPPGPTPRFRPEYLAPYGEVDMTRYRQRGGIFGNGFATLNVGTGQGCAKHCTFCYWRGHRPSLLSAQAIVDTVVDLHRITSVKQYHLAELDFMASPGRALQLARAWRERLPDASWFALASPADLERLSDADWATLAAGGCRKLELGSESGSARILRSLGKTHAPDAPLHLSRRMLAHGIEPMHNFIFGLVNETTADRYATLRLLRALHALDQHRIHFTYRLFQPTWNTPMGEAAIASIPGFPRTIEEVLDYRGRAVGADARTMPWLSARDENRVRLLVDYTLPLATSRIPFDRQRQRWPYLGLRALAATRMRGPLPGAGIERKLFRRLVRRRLDNTYTCGAC